MNEKIDDLMKKIIYFGSLSPSAHNTQPWEFKLKNNFIELYRDKRRSLGYSDPKGWETYLSLGACLTNLLESAKALGVLGGVRILPNGEENNLIAQIDVQNNKLALNEEFLDIIEKRQTNRSIYLNKEVPENLIKGWKRFGQEISVGLIPITNSELIRKVAEIQKEATLSFFSDKKFREELSHWVRNNLTKQHDGMPGYVTNIPLPMSFLGPWMIKKMNIGKMQAGMEKSWILSAPLILILTINENRPKNLISAGQVFEKIALDIISNGLVYAPLGAAVEMPSTNEKLKILLNIKETPVMLVRVGYSNKKYKNAPKRTVEEILIN